MDDRWMNGRKESKREESRKDKEREGEAMRKPRVQQCES